MSIDVYKKIRVVFFATTILGTVVSACLSAFVFSSLQNLRGIELLETYRPAAVTYVYDVKGRIIAEFYREKRELVDLKDISPHLVQATLAIEDKRFFQHYGIDFWRIVKAGLVNLTAMRKKEGGSTITIQLSKILFLDSKKTYTRKIQELWYSIQIEKQYSKKEILTLYLNLIPYGHGNYGVGAASRYYFGKSAKDLTLAEAAMLAGIPKAPSTYSPFRNPEAARKRLKVVLQSMINNAIVSEEVVVEEQKIFWKQFLNRYNSTFAVEGKEKKLKAPFFIEYIRQKLKKDFGDGQLYSGGLNVYTTINLDHQFAAEAELAAALAEQDKVSESETKKFPLRKELQHFKKTLLLAQTLGIGSLGIEEDMEKKLLHSEVQQNVKGTLSDVSLMLGAKPLWSFFNFEFSDEHSEVVSQQAAQGALISVSPVNGYITAMVGGRSFDYYNQFNRAVLLSRQVGSIIKPFVYAVALEKKILHPTTLLYDRPIAFDDYIPKNYSGKYRGPVLMRDALSKSINVLAVETLANIGIREAQNNLALIFGAYTQNSIEKMFPSNLTMGLGSGGFSPLAVATAFAVLANEGREVVPRTVRYVTDINGEVIRDYEQELLSHKAKQLLSPQTAFLISQIASGVFKRGGTAYMPKRSEGFQHARTSFGKTGTTSNWTDAWFAGANAYLSSVVWVGYDDNRSLGRGRTGGKVAAPVWMEFQKKALTGKSVRQFKTPEAIVKRRVCKQLGTLAGPYDDEKDVFETYFQNDNLPTTVCDFKRTVYEEESNLLRMLDEEDDSKSLQVLQMIQEN